MNNNLNSPVIGDEGLEAKNENIESKEGNNTEVLENMEEKKILDFLWDKKLKIIRISQEKELINSMILFSPKGENGGGLKKMLDNDRNKMNMEEEARVTLQGYLKRLNDEEKYLFAKNMSKRGLECFIVGNYECFGDIFNKKIAKYSKELGLNRAKGAEAIWKMELKEGLKLDLGEEIGYEESEKLIACILKNGDDEESEIMEEGKLLDFLRDKKLVIDRGNSLATTLRGEKEAFEVLHNYLKRLNDEEKYLLAKNMCKKGLECFIVDKYEYFGDIFNKKIAKYSKELGLDRFNLEKIKLEMGKPLFPKYIGVEKSKELIVRILEEGDNLDDV